MINEVKASGVIFLSGGRWAAEVSREGAGTGYPLYEITTSSLNDAEKPALSVRNTRRVGGAFADNNFGFIVIDWDSSVPRVSAEVRDEDGHIRLQKDILFSEIKAPNE
jgi:alkaline phosphatase D